MAEDMKARVEVWPVGADQVGLWLLSGMDALRSGNVPSDGDPHTTVEDLLAAREMGVDMIHSTSWRVDGPAVILTYVAVVKTGGLALDLHPTAKPISAALPRAVGRPFAHAPAEPPTPRYIDVLMHALRHLRFLLDTDAGAQVALDGHWRRHLAPLEPALAQMYAA